MSLELDENQLELLKWVKNHTGNGKSPVIVLDILSNLAELGDDNSAGQMQSFNMIVTKARKEGVLFGDCSSYGQDLKSWS